MWPYKSCFFVSCTPGGLVNSKSLQLFQLGYLGASLSGGSHKSWGAIYIVQTLLSSGRSWKLGFPPNYKALCQEWGLWWTCVSAFPTHFDVGILSVLWSVGVTQLAFGFLSEWIDSCVATYSVHPWEEGKLGASYSTFLLTYQFTFRPKYSPSRVPTETHEYF